MNQKFKINLTFDFYNWEFKLYSKGNKCKQKKLLGTLAILGFFSSTAFAEDLLAQITNGRLSDTSEGVRVLSAEEEKQVVGGYRPFSAGWYSYTCITMPLKNNYNANTRPQTNNQKLSLIGL